MEIKKSYRTTMPFTDGLSPISPKTRNNIPWMGGGTFDKERQDFDSNMGGDHKYIGEDPDGMSHAIVNVMKGEHDDPDFSVPEDIEYVVVDNDGKEHIFNDRNYEVLVHEWSIKGYKAIYRRFKKLIDKKTSFEGKLNKTANQENNEFVSLVANILPACAKVESESIKYNKVEIGSCFSIAEGLFLTCAHVISKRKEDPNDVSVFLVSDDRRYRASVVDIDYDIDIALIRVSGMDHTSLDFKLIETVPVGENIVCIGSPYGYDNNVSRGVISSKSRDVDESGVSYFFVDLSVFPGNSGGPVIDISDGKVIGIAAIIVQSVGNYGLNAAIPMDNVIKRFGKHINK